MVKLHLDLEGRGLLLSVDEFTLTRQLQRLLGVVGSSLLLSLIHRLVHGLGLVVRCLQQVREGSICRRVSIGLISLIATA
jgi:hypothetical protein